MLEKTKLVKKSLKSTPFKRISMKILNDDNAKLAHAGSAHFALLGPWNTVSINQ